MDDVLAAFFEQNGTRVIGIESTVSDTLRGLYPIAEEMVTESLKLISEASSYPLLVLCKDGRALTGVVIACLRKLQHWAFVSICEEYRRYAGPSSRIQQQHEQFIELFDTDLVSISASSPAFLRRASGLQPATAAVVASVGVGGGASGSASTVAEDGSSGGKTSGLEHTSFATVVSGTTATTSVDTPTIATPVTARVATGNIG